MAVPSDPGRAPDGTRRTRPASTAEARLQLGVLAVLVSLLAAAAAGPGAAQAGDPIAVDQCQAILEPGTYELTGNLTAQSSPCLEVAAGDVTLLGGGHVVRDGTGNGSVGVEVAASGAGPANVTLRNLEVRDWAGRDLLVQGASQVNLRNVTVRNATSAGLVVTSSDDVRVENLTAAGNGEGVAALEGPTNLTLADVDAVGNDGDGLNLTGVSDLILRRVEARENGGSGIRLEGVSGPLLSDVETRGNARWGLEAPGSDPVLLEGLDLGRVRVDGRFSESKVRSASLPADPPSPYRDMGRFVEVEGLAAGAWANLTTSYGADEVLDYQDETIRWWRWDGADWSEVAGYNTVDTGARTTSANATGSGVLAPLVEEDVTPPTTADDAPSRWVNDSVTVALSAQDDESGVASTSYRLDGGDWTPYGGPVDISVDGVHTLEYRSVDREDNQESVRSATVRIDGTAPTTGVNLSGNRTDDGLWEPPVQVHLAADDGGSGLNATRFRLDGGPNRTYQGSFEVREPGNHTLAYWSRDEAGNRETPRLRNVLVWGETPPTTNLATTPEAPEGEDGWYVTPPTVRLEPDPPSAMPYYRLDGGNRTPYSDPFRVPAGTRTLAFWSESRTRPNETPQQVRFRVDGSRPQVTAATLEPARVLMGEGAEVRVEAVDAGAGVADVVAVVGGGDVRRTVPLDEGLEGSWAGEIVGDPPGVHEVSVRARDGAGRTTAVAAGTLTVACPEEGACGPDVGVEVESAEQEGLAEVQVRNPPDPRNTTLVLVHPEGGDEILGRGMEATWETRAYENGYYTVVARAGDGGWEGGDGSLTLASTRYLVENPRASLQDAVLAVAAGVIVVALAGAGSGYGMRWLSYLAKVVRRALGIEYRERTKDTALRYRVLRQVAAAGVAAAVLGSAATLAGIPAWDLPPFLENLPVVGGAAVAFSVVWYGGDWVLAKLTDRTPRYVLLGSGLASLVLTTWAFRSPFGTPGYVEKRDAPSWEALGERRERYEARRTLADLGVVASAGLLFVPAQAWWSYDFGATGLLLVALTLGTGAVPVPPLPNHKVWRWRRWAATLVFLGGFGVYVGFQRAWVPPEAFAALAVLGLTGVASFVVAERRRVPAGCTGSTDRDADAAASGGRGYGRGRRTSSTGDPARGGGRGRGRRRGRR